MGIQHPHTSYFGFLTSFSYVAWAGGANGWTNFGLGDGITPPYFTQSAVSWVGAPPYVLTIYSNVTTSDSYGYINYGRTGNLTVATGQTIGAKLWLQGNGGTLFAQWARTRNYPPNNVQPTITFSAVSAVPPPSGITMTITPNTAVYPATASANAVCAPSTDTCTVESPLGTVLATGTGTAQYSIPIKSVGTYTYYANDLTTPQTASGTLSITKNSPTDVCTYNSDPTANGITYSVLTAYVYLSCSFGSYNNQLSGTLAYNGVIQSTGSSTTYAALWDNQLNVVNSNTPGNTNYTSNSLTFFLTDSPYSFLGVTYNASAYETTKQGYVYNINITKEASSANLLLYYLGNEIANLSIGVTPTNEIFTIPYYIPLQATNAVADTFNAGLILTTGEGTFTYNPINTIVQTELWNYIPMGGWKNPQTIEGGSQTLFGNLTQIIPTNGAVVADANFIVGSKQVFPLTIIPYKYYAILNPFTANAFGFPIPTLGSPSTINANAIDFQLSFESNTVWRNLSNAATFSDYLPDLVPCGGAYTTNAFNFTFWNASNPTQQYTGNVLLTGFYSIVSGSYSSPTIPGTSAGLSASATANSYQTCQYPSWAVLPVNGAFQYGTPNSITAGFYLVQQASQPPNNVHLYLSSSLTAISQYDVAVEYVPSQTFIAATVQVLQYIPNTNSSVLVNEFQTSAGSGYVINLQSGTIYRFAAYGLPLNNFLTATPYFQAACASGSTCSYDIQVGNTTQNQLNQIIGNMQYECGIFNNSMAQTNTTTCDYQSLNGTSLTTRMIVYYNASTISNSSIVCEKNLTSTSGSLSCTTGNANTTSYYAVFQLQTPYGFYTVWDSVYGHQAAIFADIGLFVFLIVILVCSCLFVFVNPAVGVIVFDAGYIACGLLGFVVINVITIGATLILSGLVIFTLYRKGRGGA